MPLDAAQLAGLYTALVTPFDSDDRVDARTMATLVEHQIGGGAAGLVPIGGTGEYPALSPEERREVVRATVDAADGRVPVIPGVLSTGLAEAVAAARDFAAEGAAAVMVVTPYYATGTQEGTRTYFRRFRESVDLPVLAYEIPRRTGVSLEAETVQAMVEDGSIIGMKYSSYDVPEFIKVIRFTGDKLAVLSGEEPLFATHMALGARGGVLATANAFPDRWVAIMHHAHEGRLREALRCQAPLDALAEAVFSETNPGPLKRLLEIMDYPVGSVRLPLLPPHPATEARLREALDLLKQ